MLGAQEQLGELLGQRFAGGRTPDTFREEHVVWGGGNARKVMASDGAAVEKSLQQEIKLES